MGCINSKATPVTVATRLGDPEEPLVPRAFALKAAHVWLQELGLPQYSNAFEDAGFNDWELLATLVEADLEAIQAHTGTVIPPGHRKKLLMASRQMGHSHGGALSTGGGSGAGPFGVMMFNPFTPAARYSHGGAAGGGGSGLARHHTSSSLGAGVGGGPLEPSQTGRSTGGGAASPRERHSSRTAPQQMHMQAEQLQMLAAASSSGCGSAAGPFGYIASPSNTFNAGAKRSGSRPRSTGALAALMDGWLPGGGSASTAASPPSNAQQLAVRPRKRWEVDRKPVKGALLNSVAAGPGAASRARSGTSMEPYAQAVQQQQQPGSALSAGATPGSVAPSAPSTTFPSPSNSITSRPATRGPSGTHDRTSRGAMGVLPPVCVDAALAPAPGDGVGGGRQGAQALPSLPPERTRSLQGYQLRGASPGPLGPPGQSRFSGDFDPQLTAPQAAALTPAPPPSQPPAPLAAGSRQRSSRLEAGAGGGGVAAPPSALSAWPHGGGALSPLSPTSNGQTPARSARATSRSAAASPLPGQHIASQGQALCPTVPASVEQAAPAPARGTAWAAQPPHLVQLGSGAYSPDAMASPRSGSGRCSEHGAAGLGSSRAQGPGPIGGLVRAVAGWAMPTVRNWVHVDSGSQRGSAGSPRDRSRDASASLTLQQEGSAPQLGALGAGTHLHMHSRGSLLAREAVGGAGSASTVHSEDRPASVLLRKRSSRSQRVAPLQVQLLPDLSPREGAWDQDSALCVAGRGFRPSAAGHPGALSSPGTPNAASSALAPRAGRRSQAGTPSATPGAGGGAAQGWPFEVPQLPHRFSASGAMGSSPRSGPGRGTLQGMGSGRLMGSGMGLGLGTLPAITPEASMGGDSTGGDERESTHEVLRRAPGAGYMPPSQSDASSAPMPFVEVGEDRLGAASPEASPPRHGRPAPLAAAAVRPGALHGPAGGGLNGDGMARLPAASPGVTRLLAAGRDALSPSVHAMAVDREWQQQKPRDGSTSPLPTPGRNIDLQVLSGQLERIMQHISKIVTAEGGGSGNDDVYGNDNGAAELLAAPLSAPGERRMLSSQQGGSAAATGTQRLAAMAAKRRELQLLHAELTQRMRAIRQLGSAGAAQGAEQPPSGGVERLGDATGGMSADGYGSLRAHSASVAEVEARIHAKLGELAELTLKGGVEGAGGEGDGSGASGSRMGAGPGPVRTPSAPSAGGSAVDRKRRSVLQQATAAALAAGMVSPGRGRNAGAGGSVADQEAALHAEIRGVLHARRRPGGPVRDGEVTAGSGSAGGVVELLHDQALRDELIAIERKVRARV